MNGHANERFPFGRDVDTLIVCGSYEQRLRAIEALQMPAQYEIITSALMGSRFSKIIVMVGHMLFAPEKLSPTEVELYARIIREELPTHLRPRGKIYVI